MCKHVETWGDHFKVKKVGASTFYVVWKATDVPVSPDFRERGYARRWIKEHWQRLTFEMTVLK